MAKGSALRVLTSGALGYLIGTFPTADLVSRLAAREHGREIDLRNNGTKNPGALNAAKLLGPKWGGVILAGDIVKGAVASVAGRAIGGDNGGYAAGTGAVYGHCAPVWNGFSGGKGLAASAGTSVALFPAYAAVDLALAAGVLALSKGHAGASTYVASGVFVAAASYWWLAKKGNAWGPKATIGLPLFAALTSVIISYRFAAAPPMPEDAHADILLEAPVGA